MNDTSRQGKTQWDSKQAIVENMNITRQYGCGDMSTFGVEHGFLEGVLRGLRIGFISSREYTALSTCQTFDDFKLSLGDTDYCQVLQNVNVLNEEIIYQKCVDKFVSEFEFIRGQACGSLATFLDFLTYKPMISNISFVISSLIKKSRTRQEFDPAELLAKCDPIGDDPHLKLLMTFENGDAKDDGLVDLYRTVLVETPVARYFASYFNRELSNDTPSGGIGKAYEEEEFEVITERLQKLALEDFYQYTQELGGETAAIMDDVLSWDADSRALHITLGSFGTPLNDANSRDSDRKSLYCNFGHFYPNGTWGHQDSETSFSRVSDQEGLATVLERFYPNYYNLWALALDSQGEKKFTTAMDEYEIKKLKHAFDSQSHFASFYAWFKLKQFELRNIKWILSCITQKVTDPRRKNRWLPIEFSYQNKKN